MLRTYEDIGVQIPRVFLPKREVDLKKWAVIACDQFTSQPEYWNTVESLVGKAPSTYNMMLPEIYLDKPDIEIRINSIQEYMRSILASEFLKIHEGLIYVERVLNGKTRRGLMLCLDLECYDFTKGSTSLIRATEGTIIGRLPPRIRIRSGAELELSHILVLIDDPGCTVLEPLVLQKRCMRKLYDFNLMLDSGRLRGYSVSEDQEKSIITALRDLAKPLNISSKYAININSPIFLYAVGDGNHSLATAKAIWEQTKSQVGMNHPSRYALVEIENIHDESLVFKPIHRLLFEVRRSLLDSLQNYFNSFEYTPVADASSMIQLIHKQDYKGHRVGLVGIEEQRPFGVLGIPNPISSLPVGTVQSFLDVFMAEQGAERLDYVHGEDVVCNLGVLSGNAGFYLPPMKKSDLFKSIIRDGVLPRKTFSLGEANEKRFYLEARKIRI